MIRRLLLLGCLFGLGLGSSGTGAAPYQLDLTRSSLKFSFVQMGVPVIGTFRTLQAQVEFDPIRPEVSQISVSVALASVDVGTAEGNAEVQRLAWFNTAVFPQAQFIAQQVQALGADRYRVTGTLSLKGYTVPLVVIAQAHPLAGGLSFTSTFSVQRLALGVGTGVWADTETVADTVQITLVLTLIPVV